MEHVESRAQHVLRRHPVRVTIVEPRRPGLRATIRELWRYRRYTSFFGRQLLAKRYVRTWLGVAWLPLRPTLSVAAKLLVFGGLVGISSGKTAYPVFFLAATAAWQLFAEAAFWSTRSLDVNRSTLRIVHVPRVVVIVSSIVPSLVDFAIHLSFALLAVAYYLIKAHIFYLEITPRTPLFVLGGLGLIAALGVGIGLVTAGVGARARDVRFGLVYSLGFLYYLTPVIYPFSNIPDMYKPVAELNPVTGAMELFKVGLFRGEVVSWKAVLVSVIAAFLLWGPGLWLFQRREVRDW